MGEETAGAADAGLHLVENQQQAVLVAQLAQAAQALRRHRTHAALALDRLDQDGGGLGTDGRLQRGMITERHLVEALDLRAEAFKILLLAAGRDRGQRAAVEGAFESDDAETFGVAPDRVILAGHLDRAFERLGTRIGEEHLVGEGGIGQPPGQSFALGDPVEVRCVPDLGGLLGEPGHEVRVGMAERVHGDPGPEIKVAIAVLGHQPGPLASLENQVGSREGRQKRGGGVLGDRARMGHRVAPLG